MTRIAAFAATVALASLAAGAASAQNSATVRFQNNSGATVYSIESSPSSSDQWGGDLLESYVLNPGQGREVTFVNLSDCYYDVRIVFVDGASFTDTFDLCSYNQYTIQ